MLLVELIKKTRTLNSKKHKLELLKNNLNYNLIVFLRYTFDPLILFNCPRLISVLKEPEGSFSFEERSTLIRDILEYASSDYKSNKEYIYNSLCSLDIETRKLVLDIINKKPKLNLTVKDINPLLENTLLDLRYNSPKKIKLIDTKLIKTHFILKVQPNYCNCYLIKKCNNWIVLTKDKNYILNYSDKFKLDSIRAKTNHQIFKGIINNNNNNIILLGTTNKYKPGVKWKATDNVEGILNIKTLKNYKKTDWVNLKNDEILLWFNGVNDSLISDASTNIEVLLDLPIVTKRTKTLSDGVKIVSELKVKLFNSVIKPYNLNNLKKQKSNVTIKLIKKSGKLFYFLI